MSTLRYGCFALLAVAAALGGCGLKGPLTLPEKSGQVVVRGKQTDTTSGEPATTPAKLPPPELPRSSSGSQTNRS